MTDAAWTLLSRRLVRRDADMEYIGVVAAAAPPWEPATYFGYCKWARVGDRHQSAVLYRGPDLPDAIAAVHERLRSKVAGTGADARYETDDGEPLRMPDAAQVLPGGAFTLAAGANTPLAPT